MVIKVVVTGLGAVTSLGNNITEIWKNLKYGKTGISNIEHFDTSSYYTKIGGTIKNFNINNFINNKKINKLDGFIQYGLAAGIQAIDDAGIIKNNIKRDDIGIIIGSGIGGITTIEHNNKLLNEKGSKKLQSTFISSCITNTIASYLSILYKITGPSLSISTACATGGHAICIAEQFIKNRKAKIMIAGGAEKAITPLVVAGFSIIKALSKNKNPDTASRPWDINRDGFVLSDGAACLILEEYEHALSRNANIYAEICGTGMTSDSYHIVSPDPTGKGIYSCMIDAIKNADICTDDVDYINAHATSTKNGDIAEGNAIENLFKSNKNIIINSTKSMTGHLLGASGSLEAIITILSIKDQMILKNKNLVTHDERCGNLRLIKENKYTRIKYAMSNSFGFGGTNSSILFKKL